ncbi:hypothetical protein ANCCEY_05636 [Ancylostoma ceylanicum]|uniref:Uncharacterized protein n=1 Tax=Ancylostoma ceylanicum TaxID=53326 RepID=A0A0D6M5P4_9BILA|nr:hypothetical protein ANCCEY_05636 [Ancylostoma ceylanicum]
MAQIREENVLSELFHRVTLVRVGNTVELTNVGKNVSISRSPRNQIERKLPEIQAESTGSINIDDLIVGSAVIILSLCIVVAHLLILKEIWFDPELAKLPSYRLLFLIGTFDIIQCTAHFATGVFTICQTTFFPLLGKLMGSLATPGYVGYSLLCVVLAVNRLVQLTSPHSGRYFAGRRFYYWLIGVSVIWLTFVFILSSPWATISYIPEKCMRRRAFFKHLSQKKVHVMAEPYRPLLMNFHFWCPKKYWLLVASNSSSNNH